VPKIVRLRCPRCREILEVNLLRGEIERHWPAGTTPAAADLLAVAEQTARKEAEDPDMGGLLKRVEDREREAEEKFGKALERTRDEPVEKPPTDEDFA
jgi:hypothetical protein